MTKDASARTARIVHSIAEVPAEAWNACANPGGAIPDNPFLDHAFLHALEASGSATARTGWQPFHVVLEDAGRIAGVVPMYLKNHSRGEYVFDSAWADAWHRAGGKYYPKLQISVPFTPATGRRLLANPAAGADVETHLIAACVQVARQTDVSSLHLTFLPEEQWRTLGDAGLLQRVDQQFHWQNHGYATFDDFLGELASKKRKNLKRERREVVDNGIDIEWVTGSDLREHHWDAFFAFYMDTGNRKWGSPYLTRKFFSLVTETMADRILLVMARRNGRYIAGALNFIGSDALYGRNWGCLEDHRFLHFEACYYQAIDFAIDRKLARVEAGAQGPHKVARGYVPQPTYSAHWIADAGFRDAIARYLKEERAYVQQDIDYLNEHTPFRANLEIAPLSAASADPESR
ncbi:MAG TPA: GNAT family N-acetyltransferase [Pseudomonadales bacterium]|nr:GNAT family N-acetyltransferase [Pseudomonadales bacterium]